MKRIYTIIISLAVLTPTTSFDMLTGTAGFLTGVRGLMNPLMYIFFGLAVLYFFWGMGQFILQAGDPKAVEEGKSKMIWGVVALFVMFSIFGIISFIGSATGISPNSGASGAPCTLGSQTDVTGPCTGD